LYFWNGNTYLDKSWISIKKDIKREKSGHVFELKQMMICTYKYFSYVY